MVLMRSCTRRLATRIQFKRARSRRMPTTYMTVSLLVGKLSSSTLAN
jgi:hypothetical protein